MIFFTADPHFGHKNVIKYCDRPYQDVEEMDEALLENSNSVVTVNDILYVIGDVAFLNRKETVKICQRWNGQKRLIYGNHDLKFPPKFWIEEAGFVEAHKLGYGETLDRRLQSDSAYLDCSMSHYPLREALGAYDDRAHLLPHAPEQASGLVLLHGHVHEKWHIKGKMLNVGVDVNNMTPISLPQVCRLVKSMYVN
jgi:calcineurin-like phosphoesterase family protein